MRRKPLILSCFLIGVAAILIGGCAKGGPAGGDSGAAPASPSDRAVQSVELIEPGDSIGEVLVTTAEPGTFAVTWDYPCGEIDEFNKVCQGNLHTTFNISYGIAAEAGQDLDQLWAETTHEINIEDRPVNLSAFGTVDLVHPVLGDIRHWNIVLVPSSPAEIVTRSKTTMEGESIESTITFVYR